ncbi:MAG: hypothetical protein AAGA37_19895 [Actinomycetota bacterium]
MTTGPVICVHCGRQAETPLAVPTHDPYSRYINAASKLTGLDPDTIFASRRRRHVPVRDAVIAAIRHHHDLTFEALGDAFDRDHTSIGAAVRRADTDLATRIHQTANQEPRR